MKVFEPFRLDPLNHCLWSGDQRVALTPKAFDVLRYLVEHGDRLVTQDEILEALWPETYVNPEGIRKYILEIRKVLGDRPGQPCFIETLPKRGYRFIAAVTDEQPQLPAPAVIETAGQMVGRDASLFRLHQHWELARNGQRQVVFVTGEAGFGKTTLVDAFQQQAAQRSGTFVARGQCIEGFGGTEAYYPLLEAVGSLILNPKEQSWAETLARQAPTWLAQFPSLVAPEQREWLQREISGSTRGRMVREICEALDAATVQAPLLLILEDLHWADASTLDFISALARRREPSKLLLIATYRPVDVALSRSPLRGLKEDLLVRQLCQEIAVERLEETDVAEFLAREFPHHCFPPAFANLIHHHSGGNALFMVTILRDIVKRGLIARERGTWTLSAPVSQIHPGIPETLQQVLDTQFEQLAEEEQRLLESCSVAGERFSVWTGAVLLDSTAAVVEEICDRLARRQQFIRFVGMHETAGGTNSPHYEFKHSLYRQALYRRLSSVARCRLHLALGEPLFEACMAGKRELAAELALHFEEGRNYEQAIRCLILTAENDSRRFAHGDAIRVLQHALELVSLLAAEVRCELELQVLLRIGDAHYALGAISDSVSAYEAAAALAAGAGMRESQIDALARLAIPVWYLDPARGSQISEQAIHVSREHGDPLLLAERQLAAACFRVIYETGRREDADACVSAHQTICRLSAPGFSKEVLFPYVRVIQGHYQDALQLAETAMSATTSPAAYLLALGVKALGLIGTGRFGEMLRLVRTGRGLAEKNGEDPWVFIFREAWLRELCFDFEGVRKLSEIMMQSDPEKHAAEPGTMAIVAAGYEALYQGRCEAAVECFAQVRDRRRAPRFPFQWRWRLKAQLGSLEAWLQAGALDRARAEADDFVNATLATPEPNLHAIAWEARARVAIADRKPDRALDSTAKALAVLDRFDLPVAAWRIHAAAWDTYGFTGANERAQAHLAQARQAVLKLADSFEAGEPLREALLRAAPIRRFFVRAASG